MEKQPDWMPVFVVLPATREVTVTADEDQGVKRSKRTKIGQDYWQRIGTAYVRQDGTIYVHLAAVPVNGSLVIRPPKAGERVDPTVSSK